MNLIVKTICKNSTDGDSDGLILIKKQSTTSFTLSFFNNDGSPFKMCFNGTLCASKYLQLFKKNDKSIQFNAPYYGILNATYHEEAISLDFEPLLIEACSHEETGVGYTGICYHVHLTDNHKIFLPMENILYEQSFLDNAKRLREPDSIFKEGANVHFVYKKNEHILIRHFEKGIERETLSCGSGCVAAASILQEKDLIFLSPGGQLHIEKKSPRLWTMRGQPQLIEWLPSIDKKDCT